MCESLDLRMGACRAGRMAAVLAVALALTVGQGACGGDDDDGDSDATGPGRGSAACQDWQDALCDFVTGCGFASRSTCDEQYQGVVCQSDERATGCSNSFNSASCAAPPPGCDIQDLADPEPAVRMCNELTQIICAHDQECGSPATAQECISTVESTYQCSDAVAISLRYEECVGEIQSLACTAMAAPAVCNSIVLTIR